MVIKGSLKKKKKILLIFVLILYNYSTFDLRVSRSLRAGASLFPVNLLCADEWSDRLNTLSPTFLLTTALYHSLTLFLE